MQSDRSTIGSLSMLPVDQALELDYGRVIAEFEGDYGESERGRISQGVYRRRRYIDDGVRIDCCSRPVVYQSAGSI